MLVGNMCTVCVFLSDVLFIVINFYNLTPLFTFMHTIDHDTLRTREFNFIHLVAWGLEKVFSVGYIHAYMPLLGSSQGDTALN